LLMEPPCEWGTFVLSNSIKMKTLQDFNIHSIHPNWFLALGTLFTSTAYMTNGVDLLAWVASVPFLIYLERTKGIRSRVLFGFTLLIAWTLAVAKIISDPIPLIFTPLFSVPITLIKLPAYLAWGRIANPRFKLLVFPMIMVVMEWIQFTFTPWASWGPQPILK
jgi:apolipoprotein N-acyltransferase